MEHKNGVDEAEIRELIKNRVDAVSIKDVKKAMASVESNVLLFDVVNPLQSSGLETLRKRAEQWFSSFDGPIGFETRDLNIVTGDDVAFSHSLNRVKARTINGQKLEMWWRSTVCYRRMDGKWMVTHEHNSVPFDPGTGKASLDLQP
ncbi:MAG TPA: nuclear transport factor 2 family protein [Acidobacteriaceae bacterium]